MQPKNKERLLGKRTVREQKSVLLRIKNIIVEMKKSIEE